MHGFKGERTLMRIHIGERDKYQGKPLYRAIVELLRQRHYAGATVLRGIMGFGASSRLHTDRIEVLSLDLPLVVECVDTEEKIAAILPELAELTSRHGGSAADQKEQPGHHHRGLDDQHEHPLGQAVDDSVPDP